MADDQDRCEWLNVSFGTGLSRQSWTKGRKMVVIVVCAVQNEDILKKCVADYQTKLKTMEEKFQLLKKQAEDKLNEFVQ